MNNIEGSLILKELQKRKLIPGCNHIVGIINYDEDPGCNERLGIIDSYTLLDMVINHDKDLEKFEKFQYCPICGQLINLENL